MEVDHDGYYFTHRQLTQAPPLAEAALEHLSLPAGPEPLPKIIDMAK
jgi:hypothetical protein